MSIISRVKLHLEGSIESLGRWHADAAPLSKPARKLVSHTGREKVETNNRHNAWHMVKRVGLLLY